MPTFIFLFVLISIIDQKILKVDPNSVQRTITETMWNYHFICILFFSLETTVIVCMCATKKGRNLLRASCINPKDADNYEYDPHPNFSTCSSDNDDNFKYILTNEIMDSYNQIDFTALKISSSDERKLDLSSTLLK